MRADDVPTPVPGFERLVWREAVLVEAARMGSTPRLVVRGDDAGLVYAAGGAGVSEITSVTLAGAFSSWPPAIGDHVLHARRDREATLRASAWGDDAFVYLGNEPFTAAWRAPGSTSLGIDVTERDHIGRVAVAPPRGFATSFADDATRTIYVVRPSDESAAHTIEIRRAGEASAIDVPGTLPGPPSHGVVLDDGSLLVAVPPRGHPTGRAKTPSIELFRVNEAGIGAASSIEGRADLIASPGCGAWLVTTRSARRIDAAGSLGDVWDAPFKLRSVFHPSWARWRDGFVFAEPRDHSLAVLASDGVHATRATAAPIHGGCESSEISVAASADGRSVLVAYASLAGVVIARADFVSDAVAPTDDVWADDRRALARQEHDDSWRSMPGTPIREDAGPEWYPSTAKKSIVRQIRLFHVAFTIGRGAPESATTFEGDAEAGRFVWTIGQDAYLPPSQAWRFIRARWSADGVVVVGHAPTAELPRGKKKHAVRPTRFLLDIPDELQPMLTKCLAEGDNLASGGTWSSTGDFARTGGTGDHPREVDRFFLRPEDALFGAAESLPWATVLGLDEPHGRLAIALAEKSAAAAYRVNAEEGAMLRAVLASRDAPQVEAAARALAAVGVIWEPGATLNPGRSHRPRRGRR